MAFKTVIDSLDNLIDFTTSDITAGKEFITKLDKKSTQALIELLLNFKTFYKTPDRPITKTFKKLLSILENQIKVIEFKSFLIKNQKTLKKILALIIRVLLKEAVISCFDFHPSSARAEKLNEINWIFFEDRYKWNILNG